jgi:nucleoside-diphosphate-sugar epimerase
MVKQIIVTGGNGYIGRRFIKMARERGYDVVLLERHGVQDGSFAWQLGQGLPTSLKIVDQAAIIHLAHDWKNTTDQQGNAGGLNLFGTRMLLDSGRQRGVKRFVFVSSQSARCDAPNIYGRLKWQTENVVQGDDCVSARVGLVYGGPRMAMFGFLNKIVMKLPVLPMLSPWRKVQPIHVDEVCSGLLALANNTETGWRGLAGPAPISFGDVLRIIAREAHGLNIFIISVPLYVALFAARVINAIPFLPKVDEERILGLAGTEVMACADHLSRMCLQVLPISQGLRADPLGRRGLIAEGRTLLSYVLRDKPRSSLLRLYVKAVKQAELNSGPMGLFILFVKFPGMLRFIEPIGGNSILAKRLKLAAVLADSSTPGPYPHTKRVIRLMKLMIDIALDIVALPFRAISSLVNR